MVRLMLDPAQITALYNDIQSGPLAAECTSYIASHDVASVTAAFNRHDRPTTVAVPGSYFTVRSLMAALGASQGATILDKLDAVSASDSVVKWVLRVLNTMQGIDLGNPETRAQLDALASAGVLTTAERDAMKALAERAASRAEELFGVGVVITNADVWATGVVTV